MIPRIVVQAQDFDVGAELARLGGDGTGGIASFVGIVRGRDPGGRVVAALTLEHYPGMTERALTKIAVAAGERWPLTGCTIIHRIGRLPAGANIVFTAAASAHRAAALAANEFLINWLKTDAPFWKAETYTNGDTAWVAANPADARPRQG